MRIPLTWPKGTYGLPMPKSGCPKGSNFQWHAGYRSHGTEDTRQKFGMKAKDTASDYNLPWPGGPYCILKKGKCPEGLCYL